MSDARTYLDRLLGRGGETTSLPPISEVPPTSDRGLSSFLTSVKQWISTASGDGGVLGKLVSWSDLVDSGFARVDSDGTPVPGDGTLDYTPPPAPLNLTAVGAMTNILLEWDPPLYGNHAYTEVWAAATDALGTAVLIGTTSASLYSHATGPAQTRYYWVRFVSAADVAGPYNASAGVVGATSDDPGFLLDVLTGEITESQLFADLGARIDLIDTPTTGLVARVGITEGEIDAIDASINTATTGILARVGATESEIDTINATLADLSSTPPYDAGTTYAIGDTVTYDGGLYRAIAATTGNLPTNVTYWEKIGDYASIGDAVAGHAVILDDHETRITTAEGGITAEVTARETLATQVRGAYTGTDIASLTTGLIYNEKTARSSADSAEVTARQALSAKLTGVNDPASLTLATLTSGLVYDEKTARVSEDSAIASSVSTLSAQVNHATTGLPAAHAAVVTEASTRASADTALSSSITTLTSTVNTKNKTYSQTTPPASGMTAGDIWFDTDDNNKAYRYSGSAWVATDDARIASNTAAIQSEASTRASADSAEVTARQALSAKLTGVNDPASLTLATLTSGLVYDEKTARVSEDSAIASSVSTLSAQVNHATTGLPAAHAAVVTEASTRASADGALASDITTLSTTVGGHTTSLSTQATSINGLEAQYTVKIDANGYVTGFGLASTLVDATPYSEFGVRADKFYIASPAGPEWVADYTQSAIPTGTLEVGDRWLDTGSTNKCLYSDDFLNAVWENGTNNVTPDALTLYDGSKLSLVESLTALRPRQSVAREIGTSYVTSVRAKAGTSNWLRMRSNAVATWFDLLTGTVGSANTDSAGIIDEGDGVYRCWVQEEQTSTWTWVELNPVDADASAVASGTMYLGAVQVEEGVTLPGRYVKTLGTPASTVGDNERLIWDGTNWIPDTYQGSDPVVPFIAVTTPTMVNGVAVPVGVYMDSAYIQNGSIVNAKIGDAAIDNAKISSLSASKLTAGSIAVGEYIESDDYVPGVSGWRVYGDGTAEFSNVSVRGDVNATSGSITGLTITGGTLQTATTGQRIEINDQGMLFLTGDTPAGKYGSFKYGTGVKYGSGVLVFFNNVARKIPFYVQAEQTVADMHLYNRASNPTGPAEIGDLAVVAGKLKICTVTGTPGTWVVVGTQT